VNWFARIASSFFTPAARVGVAVCLLLAAWGCSDDPEKPQPVATVAIAIIPDTLQAPWELSGPGEYREVPPIWDTFVTIPAGTFMMGGPPDEPGSEWADCNEYPQHEVTLTRLFLMQVTEVTNKEFLDLANRALGEGWARADEASLWTVLEGATTQLMNLNDPFSEIKLLGNTLRLRDAGFGRNPYNPAGNMTWNGAAAYCDWLSLMEGIPRAYDHGDWSWGNAGAWSHPVPS
jgi:formylglycine-generating enzyme required for sulfatase activity